MMPLENIEKKMVDSTRISKTRTVNQELGSVTTYIFWHQSLHHSNGRECRGVQCLVHAPSVFAFDPFQSPSLGGKGLVTCTGARHHRVTDMFWLHFQRYLMLFICAKHSAQASVIFASRLVKTCKMRLVVPLQHSGSPHTPLVFANIILILSFSNRVLVGGAEG